MKQKYLLITVGVPGCGKTTWCKDFIKKNPDKNIKYISRDEIRFSLLEAGDYYFAHEDDVIVTLRQELLHGIKDSEIDIVIADATHLNERARRRLLNMIPTLNLKIVPVYFDCRLETCLARNEQRSGRAHVPADTIQSMANLLVHPKHDKNANRYWYILNVDESGKTTKNYGGK